MSFLFGSDDGGYDEASDLYRKYLNKSMRTLSGHEEQGRGDIEDYLRRGVGYEAPYREAGTEALGELKGSLGLDGAMAQQGVVSKFRATPGYQFALKTGLDSAKRSFAGSGMTGSGAELAELQKKGQGMADQEFGRYQTQLGALAGAGQEGAARAGALTAGTGSTLANLGYGYAGGEAGLYEKSGEGQADALMAQKLAEEKRRRSMWSAIGTGVGALASFI